MKINELLKIGIDLLKEYSLQTPVKEAGVILSHVLECDISYIYAHGEKIVEDEKKDIFIKNIKKRTKGYPLQYIIGTQEFMSLEFIVDENVLIPKQDTEILVEHIIEYTEKKYKNKDEINILDIGSGSGCIAVSLAYYIKNAKVTSLDISHEALRIANINSNNNNTSDRVTFKQLDILNDMIEESYDIIVSNPPYIPYEDIKNLMIEVQFEPKLALDGGLDGLDFYRAIINKLTKNINEKGMMAFEVGINQSQIISELMKEKYIINIIKDYSGIDRVVSGIKNNK